MIERTIAKRYAKALLEVSVGEKRVRETEAEILAVSELYRTAPLFRKVVTSPVFPRAQKKSAIDSALSGKVGPTLVRFLQVLVEEGRAAFLPDIATVFDALADAHEGVVRVSVSSARALSPAQRDRLRGALERLAGGRSVELTVAVDPALIAGILVRIGESVVDGTVAGRLKRLKEHLTLAVAR